MNRLLKHLQRAIILSFTLFAMNLSASQPPVSVEWIMGKNEAAKNMYSSSFVIKNISNQPLGNDWSFYYNNFARKTVMLGKNTKVKFVDFIPSYYRICPTENYKALAPGDTVRIDFLTLHPFLNISYKPDGGHLVMKNGEIIPINIKIAPLTEPTQWESAKGKFATYPDGEYLYVKNTVINQANTKLDTYNVLPTPKSVVISKGVSTIGKNVIINAGEDVALAKGYLVEKLANCGITENKKAGFAMNLSVKPALNANPEYYEMTVAGNKLNIVAASQEGVFNGVKTLLAVIEKGKVPMKLPNATIKDYPDLNYRGMMLDVARNFTNYTNLKRYIDMLATYKVNKFHFHFSDDEAWRLEIAGLPELTEVGSRKGYTLDETEFLIQTYTGTGNPNDNTSSNGYISRTQFIDLLKYAKQRGVEIIPEIESPGHARAAIKSMKARYNKYIATNPAAANEFKVWDDNDSSNYVSPQGYQDNVLNFAEDGTYRFMEKVIDEIIKMYADAGVELPTLHLGGDEVPSGSWEKSQAVIEFLKKNNLSTVHQGAEYFLDRVSKMLADRNIKAGGWQEVAVNHSADFNAKVAPRFSVVNSWSTMGRSDSIPYHIANSGYKVVLSNVTNFYFDMVHSRHQYEEGLNWGGAVDEFTAWNALPYKIYSSARINNQDMPLDFMNGAKGKTPLLKKENIVGVQAQLWAETIRNFDMVCSYTIPRIFGLAERGWNVSPKWSENLEDKATYEAEMAIYNAKIGNVELPKIHKMGLNFHLAMPGIKIENGKLLANKPYPAMEIRYTTDGSEPTKSSPLWTAPIDCTAKTVKARGYYLDKETLVATYTK